MADGLVEFRAVVEDEGADGLELDDLLRQLHEDLLDTDVASATPVGAAPPRGAKAVEAVEAIAIAAAGGTLPAIVSMLHAWAAERRCTLRLHGPNGATLEMPGLTMDEAREVVAGWASTAVEDD